MKCKITISIFLSLIAIFSVQAQAKDICSRAVIQSWNTTASVTSFTSVSDAKKIIQEIIKVIGLKPNFEVQAANIPNAAAVAYRGKRYVLYNPDFINRLNNATGNEWASASVLAHEIGHHLNGHTLENIGSQPDKELEADEFSGFVLRRMGASLQQAQLAMKIAADYKRSLTHPGQQERLIAIAGGWQNANQQITGKQDVAKVQQSVNSNSATLKRRPDPVAPTASHNTVIADKYILGDVYFKADSKSTYYVTVKHHLIKVYNNQLSVIGKIKAIKSVNFPYIITDEASTTFFVDAKGNIVSKDGKKIGLIKAHAIV